MRGVSDARWSRYRRRQEVGWQQPQEGFSLCGILERGDAAGRRCWFVNEFEQPLAEAVGSNCKMPGGNQDVRDIPGDIHF